MLKTRGRWEFITDVSLEGDGVCIRVDSKDHLPFWIELVLTRKDLLDMLKDSGYEFPETNPLTQN